jgi:hypothetical protein
MLWRPNNLQALGVDGMRIHSSSQTTTRQLQSRAKYCPKFSQIYSKLERNLAIEQLDWALELRSLMQAEKNFIRTVEYMDKQFIEIKKARIGLFDYDLPGLDRFCDIIVDR